MASSAGNRTSPATENSGSMESTPASSPPPTSDGKRGISKAMQEEEDKMARMREREEAKRDDRMARERQKDVSAGKAAVDQKFKSLEYLLNQSKLYSTIMLSQMQKQEEEDQARDEKDVKKAKAREERAEKAAESSQRNVTRASAGKGTEDVKDNQDKKSLPRGRGRSQKKDGENKISSYFSKEDLEAKAGKSGISEALQEAADSEVKTSDVGIQNLRSARQPELVSGGTMRQYQLEGLEWLTGLYENGLNGILADEMGLGKTIQTISFLAFLREKGTFGPFLIAAPLSTTSNWVEEFQKWTPKIPVVLYHGSKPEREEIRRKKLKRPGSEDFPVVVTSYEICMNDRKFLAGFGWKFIIIDEGHRIKNLNCRLIRELQTYQSANRLLITGTPLQNNLTELWSLLHFLMPQIFDKLESFESWFDFSALKDKDGYEQIFSEERKQRLVSSLHAILKPFLLRRVKNDVEKLMPKKREYVLFAPLMPMQRELYQAILDGNSRSYLEDKAVEHLSREATPLRSNSRASLKRKALDNLSRAHTPSKSAKTSRASTPATTASGRSRRAPRRQNYEELSDTKYFKKLEDGDESNDGESTGSENEEEQVMAQTLALAKKQISMKKLQNPIMQLRLCCDSPYNFFNPFALSAAASSDVEAEEEADETLVSTSGKMMLLDAILPALFEDGHKVLVFSQFKTQLDLLETYATQLRGWNVCRIDGSVPQSERQAQIKAFNEPTGSLSKKAKSKQRNKKNDEESEIPEPSNLFLLSTRAGGQGINLAAADTVILFDSDWNPQQDLQAQDRAHRIGQTRNVIVYRFATRNTIEQTLLEQAEGKRRLEKLVIQKGGILRDGGNKRDKEDKEDYEALQKLLRRGDGERWDVEHAEDKGEVLSKKDLAILTDRSDEAYERAEKGLDVSGDAFKAVESKGEGGLLESLKT